MKSKDGMTISCKENDRYDVQLPSDLVVGRKSNMTDEKIFERGPTEAMATAEEFFWGANEGRARGELRWSTDDEDRGGFILRLTIPNDDENFCPFARVIPDGIEIHVAGDGEGDAAMDVLRKLVAAAPEAKRTWEKIDP